jgi:hypothetical protein
MCIALIGGMDRLERHYKNEAERAGVSVKVFNRADTGLAAKIRNVDAVVVFTNKVSHRAKQEAMNAAKARNIPVFFCRSCGVCTLRDCINCLRRRCDHRADSPPEGAQ